MLRRNCRPFARRGPELLSVVTKLSLVRAKASFPTNGPSPGAVDRGRVGSGDECAQAGRPAGGPLEDQRLQRRAVDRLRLGRKLICRVGQAAGEIDADLDPAYVLLALFGAAMAPAALPQFAENFTGLPPDSPEFVAAYQEQLTRMIARLARFREQPQAGRP